MIEHIEHNPMIDIVCDAVMERISEIPSVSLVIKAYGVLQALMWIVSELDHAEARSVLINDLRDTLGPGVEELISGRAAQERPHH